MLSDEPVPELEQGSRGLLWIFGVPAAADSREF